MRVTLLHAAEVSCWMVTGERQSARIRSLYLKTILKQDIAFFDTETNTGEVISRMSGDTILIQEAMGEKVYKSSSFSIQSRSLIVIVNLSTCFHCGRLIVGINVSTSFTVEVK